MQPRLHSSGEPTLTAVQATWLPREEDHSCGTAPESHRTSLYGGARTRGPEHPSSTLAAPPAARRPVPGRDEQVGPTAIVLGMKRLLSVIVAGAIVGAIVTLKVRSRSEEEPRAEGSWELADEPNPS